MDYKQFEGHTPIDNWDEFVYELKERITWCESDPDARSWGYEEGVLISKNEAQSILARCQELERENKRISDALGQISETIFWPTTLKEYEYFYLKATEMARAALKNDKV